MKYYLADILTFLRFIFAIAIILLAIFGSSINDIGLGLMLFILAELTDAFDGTCATRWPFPKGKIPKYRKYAVRYDMYADAFAGIAAILFFILRVNFIVGASIATLYIFISLIIEIIVYGKLFGHPDDARPNSLVRRNFPLAKKTIMIRRFIYLILIAMVAIWMLFASNWLPIVKVSVIIVSVISCAFLWFFLAERRHHISRNAVELEKKLTKNSR